MNKQNLVVANVNEKVNHVFSKNVKRYFLEKILKIPSKHNSDDFDFNDKDELNKAVSVQNDEGKTIFMNAIDNKKIPFAVALIESCRVKKVGINLEIQDNNGETSLHKAVKSENYDLVEELFSVRGYAKVLDLKDKDGNSPLLLAVKNNSYEIAKLLVHYGADKEHLVKDKNKEIDKTKENKRDPDIAKGERNKKFIEKLMKHKDRTEEKSMDRSLGLTY